MEYANTTQILFVTLIVFCSIGIQAMIGFGNALIATPLLLSLEMPLTDIVVITTVTSAFQRLIFGYQMRQFAQIKKFTPVVIALFFGVPIGIYILGIVSEENQAEVKQVIGVLILLTVFIQLSVKIKPRKSINRIWGYLAGLFAGILNGFANIGGPPLIIWVYSHNWMKEQLRAAPLLLSIPMIPLQLGLLFYYFDIAIEVFLFALLLFPVALFANQMGQIVGKKFNMMTLRKIVITSLGGIGFYYVFQPYV